MKKTHFLKRALSLALAVSSAMSLCVFPVTGAYEEAVEPFPNTGVIFYDDFESYHSKEDAVNNGPYYSFAGASGPVELGGHKVWSTQINGASSNLWYYPPLNTTIINSGQLTIQMTVQVASGYAGTKSANGIFPSVYLAHWNSADGAYTRWGAFGNTSNADTAQGGAIYPVTDALYVPDDQIATGKALTFSADTPHMIALVLDYTANKTYWYLDGVKQGEISGAVAFDKGDALGILSTRADDTNFPADGSGKRPYIYIDDLRLERTADSSEHTILNRTFETDAFPSTSTTNVNWLDVNVSGGTSTSGYANMSDWTFSNAANEANYVSKTTINGSNALCFAAKMPYDRSESSQSLVLPFDKAVTGGKLTLEFDADFITTRGNARFAFGLRDTSSPVTGYNPWNSWGNAVYLGGLGMWSGFNKALLLNSEDKPNMIPDCYLYYGTPGGNPVSGTWGSHSTELQQNFLLSNAAVNAGNDTKRWKYVIDLDAQTYEFYLDNVLKMSLDYIPGGTGKFDAFVASYVGPENTNDFGNSSDVMNLYLDNVKVTHENDAVVLESVKLIDAHNQELHLDSDVTGVTTSIMQARLGFNSLMDAQSVKNNISVTTESDSPIHYTVEPDGKFVNIYFPNFLNKETKYILNVGNVSAASGASLAAARKFHFTTNSGHSEIIGPNILVDGRPINSLASITEDSTVSAETIFFDSTGGSPLNGNIYLAAYKNGKLIGAKTDRSSSADGIGRVQIDANAKTDGFYGADKIRAFIFDDQMHPLKESVDFPSASYAYVVFSDFDANTQEATICRAVDSAKMGSGSTPVPTQKGAYTGWLLDADNNGNAYIAVDLANTFTEGLSSEETVKVQIDYYNEGNGGFALVYQGQDGEVKGKYTQLTPQTGWRQAEFILEDASFANDCKGKDFYITASDSQLTTAHKRIMGTSVSDVVINAVRVYKEKTISPFDITVETGKPGNVFVHGQYSSIKFDIDFYDPKGEYTSGTAVYTVKDHNGGVKKTVTHDFSGGKDVLEFHYDDLPLYGIYTLEIDVTGENNISQHKIVDFAHSLPGTTNMNYGTNLHYDWGVYSQQDIMDQIDLVKNAGFGFTRSKITWAVSDPDDDGNFVIEPNAWFANEYLDSLGLENLCLIAPTHTKYNPVIDGKRYVTLTSDTARERFAAYAAWAASDTQLGQWTDYFSLMNEYNIQGPLTWDPYDNFYSIHQPDSYKDYVAAVKLATPAIREANPNAVIITGEVSKYQDEWMKAAYGEGLDDYSDVLAYHTYEFGTSPEYYLDRLTPYNDGTDNTWRAISPWKATEVIKSEVMSGRNDEVWLTETGMPTREDSIQEKLPEQIHTVSTFAKWAPRYFALFGDNVDKIFTYAFTDNNIDHFYSENNFGIIRAHDYRTPFAAKPAYVTVSAFNYFIAGDDPVTPTVINDSGDRRGSGFMLNYPADQSRARYKDGMIMAWTGPAASAKTITPNISGASTLLVYDMYGNYVSTINNNTSYTLPEIDKPFYFVKAN